MASRRTQANNSQHDMSGSSELLKAHPSRRRASRRLQAMHTTAVIQIDESASGQVQDPPASPGASPSSSDAESSRTGARKREAPASLPDYAAQKGSLSVTDIVGPLWCEYQTQYNVLGLSFLPVHERPTEIKTPEGNVVRPSLGASHKREKILNAGRQTHERLEREVFPIQVKVRTTTREDAWGLKILQLIIGIRTLIKDGCTRELPVFGFVGGKLVNGIIDEISRRPLPRHILRFLDAPREAAKPAAKLDDFFQTSKTEPKTTQPLTQSDANGKKWTSQEAWKKEKLRKARSQPSPTTKSRTSPRKVAKQSAPDSSQARLASFFSTSVLKSAEVADVVEAQDSPAERYGYYIEDSKTRKRGFAPDVPDQQPSRLQCMLYKRLLDGLLSGGGKVSTSAARSREARVLELDDFADATTAMRLFEHLQLDTSTPLSETFIKDATDLSHGLHIHLNAKDGTRSNLEQIAALLQEALSELAMSARHGLGWTEPVEGITGAVQEQLFLTYRRRRKSNRVKRSQLRHEESKQPAVLAAIENQLSSSPLPDGEKIGGRTSREEEQVASAIQASLELKDAEQKLGQLEEEGQRHSTPQPHVASSPTSAASTAADLQSSPTDATKVDGKPLDKDIIARVRFTHSPRRLEEHLRDVLAMWRGERPLRGVSLDNSWRCIPCAYREDCEWRERKGQETLDAAARKRMAEAGGTTAATAAAIAVVMAEQEDENDEDKDAASSGSSDDEEDAKASDGMLLESQPSRLDEDDEELWSQFEDIPMNLEW